MSELDVVKFVKYYYYHYSDRGTSTIIYQFLLFFFFGDPYCFGDPGTFLVILVLVFISGSDSEGNEEPVVGNVNKFCVVPPGFTGRPRRGHLIFDACFESGTIHLTKDFQ